MNYRKRILFIVILISISFQFLLYLNNNQKSSLRFLVWNIKDIKVGKLISSSFISGFFVSTLLNKTVLTRRINEKTNNENLNFKDDEKLEFEDTNSKIEMPPERNLRDTQPTISVNYRVIKNAENNNLDDEYIENKNYKDDWDNIDNDW